MKVTVLGCGGSGGVPMVGNVWGACNPHNPKNVRTRVSVLIEKGDTRLLIDCGPDLRQQLIATNVTHVDACLVTHHHSDHTHGIDDLRRLFWINGNTPIDLYGDPYAIEQMSIRFPFAFEPFHYGAGPLNPLVRHVITDPFRVGEVDIVPFVQDHGYITSLGFRFGNFAYSTDVVRLTDENFAALDGVTHWLVDCVQYEAGHKAHSHFEQTLSWIERVKPRQSYLTHMGTALDYDDLLSRCPKGVEPAYDGLVFHVDDE